MTTIRKVIISSIIGGFSLAVTLAIIIGIVAWFNHRPTPPKPWDKLAITATYDSLNTEGQENYVVFHYTLQNNTAYDYKFADLTNILLMAKLKRQKSLSGQKNDEWLYPDFPIMIPAKQRIRFTLHTKFPYDKSLKKNATRAEREQYSKKIEAYANKEWSNLDGFVLFDETARYQIEFPKGW
jgi:hypothetical protein